MISKNTLKLAFLLVFSLIITASIPVNAADEGVVAGAEIYSESATPEPTPEEIIIDIPSPTPSKSSEPVANVVMEKDSEGILEWILASQFLWVALALLVAIIVTVYLRRKKKDDAPLV